MTVFLSYSRNDQEKVSAIYDLLTADGYDVFMDTDIHKGSDFRKRISIELEKAKCIVGFWSETSINSQWVIDEADYAKLHGKLIPALLDSSNPPIGFGNLNAANLRESLIMKDSVEYGKFRQAIDMVINGEFETELPLREGLDKILEPLPSKDYREFKTQQGDLNTSVTEAVRQLVAIQDSQTQLHNSQTQLLNAQAAKIEASTKRWEIVVYPSMFAFIILMSYTFYLVYSLARDIHVIAGATDQNLPMISSRSEDVSDSISRIGEDTRSIASDVASFVNDTDTFSLRQNVGVESRPTTTEP